MLGHHWHASETPFKWRFAGGPMTAHFKWSLDPHKTKKQTKSQSWSPFGKTFWIRVCAQCAHNKIMLTKKGTILVLLHPILDWYQTSK